MKICTEVLSKVFSAQLVNNSFFKVKFGLNPGGIFGATPTDLMHAFEEGIVPYFLKVFVEPLTKQQKLKLDTIAGDTFSGNNRHGV